jgi:hypothetical protein
MNTLSAAIVLAGLALLLVLAAVLWTDFEGWRKTRRAGAKFIAGKENAGV